MQRCRLEILGKIIPDLSRLAVWPTAADPKPGAAATLTVQIIDAIMQHVGIHMTPHQFRHFGATSYLEEHPEDFETARQHLGHAWSKTTRIYAGSSSRRASRAYNQHLFKQREALKLMRSRRKRGS